MLFSSLTFLFMFLPLFFIWYFAAKKRYTRNIILLIFSLVFYAWGEPLYIMLMIFSIIFNFYLAKIIDKNRSDNTKKKLWLITATAGNLLLIGIFKYTSFFVSTINLIPGINIPVPEISLPIGISFYTFQILSYVIDVYKNTVPVQNDIIYLGTYLSAFPQLIAGPIVRYQTVADELDNRKENLIDFTEGIRRFIIGLSKKVLIANNVAVVADMILANSPQDYGVIGAWIAMLSYTLQIFFDFSGYSDMAIGLGKMMGFHYLENFNYPYIAVSITDFWRRWHISLSSFFRDYVYIPLGGNRVSNIKWVRNILIVWMLTGLWHGSSWNFVLWGVYFGILLIIEKILIGKYIEKIPALGHIYTLIMVVFGWVIFRAESLSQIVEIAGAMLGVYGWNNGSVNIAALLQRCSVDTVFIISFIAGLIFSAPVANKIPLKIPVYIKDIFFVLSLALCIIQLAIGSYNPFIYFRF